jgi:tRNA threonylcarbamoyl adenosine modification protein YeaZ
VRLLLDSSGPELVAALADGRGVIHELREPSRPPAGRDIGQVVGEVIGELRPRDLRSVIVGLGPGSFIGTRVAVSYANGFCANGGTALYGVNSLAAMASVYGSGRSIVLRDARRGQFYLHPAWGAEPQSSLVSPVELPAYMERELVRQVLLESPAEGIALPPATLALLRDACAISGASLLPVPGVPTEGLRRLEASASRLDYAEPVYLRGWIQ